MTKWLAKYNDVIIRFAFLIPIILVAIISISHVVTWYDMANPFLWAVYLSVAIEVAALAAIAAASVKVKGVSVWIVFGFVTLVQFIGNIFYSYTEIDVSSTLFKDWIELTYPIFEAIGSDMSDSISQRRWLALLEGGLLPIISLTCLHFFIQYESESEIDNKIEEVEDISEEAELVPEEQDKDELTDEEVEQLSELIKESPKPSAVLNKKDKEEILNNDLIKQTVKGLPDSIINVKPKISTLSNKMKRILRK